ncbi:hypothetical protein BJX76DRAFT_368418 [Aspergillus varians]
MSYLSQTTARSPDVLLSFPQEILSSIFDHILTDEVYGSTHGIWKRASCRTVSLGAIVSATKSLRGVCSAWADTTRSLVFRGKSSRRDLVLRLPGLLDADGLGTFPLLRDCMVEFCNPYSLRELYALQRALAGNTHAPEYTCAVAWYEDRTMDMMRGTVSGMGYGRFTDEICSTFIEECVAAGLDVVDHDGTPAKQRASTTTDEDFKTAGLQALKNFFFKETLALWYYNAQVVRQILSVFSNLEYLELPAFLHIPLLARIEYFFPQCIDETLFAPVSLGSPQMLLNLGITYREGGRRYSDMMASLKGVDVYSSHYNPILAVLPRILHRIPSALVSIFVANWWGSPFRSEIGYEIIELLADQANRAVDSIPESRMPKVIAVESLRNIMDEPYK